MSDFNGQWMHALARRLWPIHRSITGDGTRQTLKILQEQISELQINEVPSGAQVFDWIIPNEWNIKSAKLYGPNNEVVVDYANNNLHVVGYSIPIDTQLSLEELNSHLHSIPEQPEAIPYVTSYYHPNWGFCLPHNLRETLRSGTYRAIIDSSIEPGSLTYGDLVVPGKVKDEIFISTYVCHPSMANNELSGPVVTTALAKWIMSMPEHHYTYRFVFAPESIGAITYASHHLQHLKRHVVAGFQLTCIGDDRHFTYLASRRGNTRIDRISRRVLSSKPGFVEYSYLGRGSDERTYASALIDLPFVSIMRTRYGDYPEYHTSEDDLESVVTPSGLQGGFDAVKECIEVLESEPVLTATTYGEPQLGRRGLYHTMLNKNTSQEVALRTDVLAYSDGHHSLRDIEEILRVDAELISRTVSQLRQHGLIIAAMESASESRAI